MSEVSVLAWTDPTSSISLHQLRQAELSTLHQHHQSECNTLENEANRGKVDELLSFRPNKRNCCIVWLANGDRNWNVYSCTNVELLVCISCTFRAVQVRRRSTTTNAVKKCQRNLLIDKHSEQKQNKIIPLAVGNFSENIIGYPYSCTHSYTFTHVHTCTGNKKKKSTCQLTKVILNLLRCDEWLIQFCSSS